jgi:hypothetical protein
VTDSIAPGDVRVTTRYNPATNTRGSSVTAQANGRQLTIPYPHEAHDAHEAAARALLAVLYADDPGRVERVTLRLDAQRSRGFVYVAGVAPDAPTEAPPERLTPGTFAHVAELPDCDVHLYERGVSGVQAGYDGKTQAGPWAYMCGDCFVSHGTGLGVGRGQRLLVRATS